MVEQVIDISQEKAEKARQTRDSFHKIKKDLQSIIEKYSEEIKGMKKSIEQARPIIEGCDSSMICTACDIYSMELKGDVEKQGAINQKYSCIACGGESYSFFLNK
ncbi:MAG: hypothetical protein AABY15_06260 [Nanoarchaeota archaeon]